jgi:hypothetical protein
MVLKRVLDFANYFDFVIERKLIVYHHMRS